MVCQDQQTRLLQSEGSVPWSYFIPFNHGGFMYIDSNRPMSPRRWRALRIRFAKQKIKQLRGLGIRKA